MGKGAMEKETHDDTEHPRRRRRETITCSTVFRRENLRRNGVQNTIHDLRTQSVSIGARYRIERDQRTLLKKE